ncbi:MAG TPA: substrate-binding domain-containing protein [Thermoleophilia bacterium]
MNETVTLGFSQYVMNHPYRLAHVESIKAAGRRMGCRIIVTDAHGDSDQESANIQYLLSRGVDGLIVSSASGRSIYKDYVKVAERRIPLVIFATGLPLEDSVPFSSFVGCDEQWMGAEAAQYLGHRLNGRGDIYVLRGPRESTNSIRRGRGFMARLSKAFPHIDVVETTTCDWLRESANVETRKILVHHQVDAIFAENDEMALGAVDGLRQGSSSKHAFVVGIDGQHEALRQIWQRGSLVMTVRHEWDGSEAVRVVLAAIRGESVPRLVELNAVVIDASNVEQYLRDGAPW